MNPLSAVHTRLRQSPRFAATNPALATTSNDTVITRYIEQAIRHFGLTKGQDPVLFYLYDGPINSINRASEDLLGVELRTKASKLLGNLKQDITLLINIKTGALEMLPVEIVDARITKKQLASLLNQALPELLTISHVSKTGEDQPHWKRRVRF